MVILQAVGMAVLLGPLLRLETSRPQEDALRGEVARLRGEVAALGEEKKRWENRIKDIDDSMRAVTEGLVELKEKSAGPLAGPFLTAPPPSSDTVGVAKVAVFAPRLEAEAQRRRDIVFLKLRRVETGFVRLVAELELPADQPGVDLPIDQSGALYIVEWATSDGNAYALQLKDGTSTQLVATVQVRQLQGQGRFIFVGYRAE